MKNKNYYLITAGVINLITALIHTIGGQITLIHPLITSGLSAQVRFELLGAWHLVTILLFGTSYLLLRAGWGKGNLSLQALSLISILYILFALPSIFLSISSSLLIPQWILCLPIGLIALLGLRRIDSNLVLDSCCLFIVSTI